MAGIPSEIIEEIRNRCDIAEVIGNTVQLKRSGQGTFKGLCPFHNEKTPSFHVNANRQTFHCFGCGKGGDVFRFFMERDNLTFVDAVKMLASRCGVVIPEDNYHSDGNTKSSPRERLYEINEKTSGFYSRYLESNPDSPIAQYLQKRGLPQEIVKQFKIGAAPDNWDSVVTFCRKLGFSDQELLESGIARSSEKSRRLYDFFRNRLIFTICNDSGRPVGFSARSLEDKPKDGGKYINTSETLLFHKGKLLYALSESRSGIRNHGFALICEGQMDAIAFHRSGFDCAVAPLGSKFTADQAKILKRYTDNFVFAFDADAAGLEAMHHAVEIALPLSVNMKVIHIPGGKDPDELLRNGGIPAVKAAVDSARPWYEAVISHLPEKFDFSSPVGRSQAAGYMANLLKLVTNQVELESYVQLVASALQVSVQAVYSQLGETRQQDIRKQEYAGKTAPKNTAAKKRYPVFLLTMLDLAVNAPGAARMMGDLIEPEELPDLNPVSRAINIAINCELNGESEETVRLINEMIIDTPEPEISRILTAPEKCLDVEKAVRDTIAEFRKSKRNLKIKKLREELSRTGDPGEKTRILQELLELSKKH